MLWMIWVLVIGVLAGFIASKLVRGSGFGILIDLLLGVVGSFLGAWIFGILGLVAYGLVGRLVMAIVGAVVLLLIVRAIKKA